MGVLKMWIYLLYDEDLDGRFGWVFSLVWFLHFDCGDNMMKEWEIVK